MNYKKLHDLLIGRAKQRIKPDGYVESHHIVPKAMGGSDAKQNRVYLTAREHFIVHWCIAKIYGGNMWTPIIRMRKQHEKNNIQYNSRLYEIARIAHSIQASKIHLNKKRSPATCSKISESLIGKPQPWHSERMKGNILGFANKGKKRPDVTVNQKGKKKPDGFAQKMSIASKGNTNRRGKLASVETKQKLSLAKLGNPWSPSRRAAHERSTFNRKCIALNALIDSVFQPEVVMTSA